LQISDLRIRKSDKGRADALLFFRSLSSVL